MPKLIFMYGFPASGKTTYARKLAAESENTIYLAADEIRREIYGSQDHFGNPEEIYRILLMHMIAHLANGQNVVYDACNLYRQFRLDYLQPLKEAGIDCQKTLIRINTTKETCLANHAKRGRNFDINDIAHYFDLKEYPVISEGWDDIIDVPDHTKKPFRVFMTTPSASFSNMWPDSVYTAVKERLRTRGYAVTTSHEHNFWSKYHDKTTDFTKGAVEKSDAVIQLIAGTRGMNTQITAEAQSAARYAMAAGRPVFGLAIYDDHDYNKAIAINTIDGIIDTLTTL